MNTVKDIKPYTCLKMNKNGIIKAKNISAIFKYKFLFMTQDFKNQTLNKTKNKPDTQVNA